jgi:hypothetical protein
MNEIVNQELGVQCKSGFWQQFPTGHHGFLLICEGDQIGAHSCSPEKSWDAKGKATHSTPSGKVYHIVGK